MPHFATHKLLAAFFALSLVLTACGGGGGSENAPPATPVAAADSVATIQSAPFTATVQGQVLSADIYYRAVQTDMVNGVPVERADSQLSTAVIARADQASAFVTIKATNAGGDIRTLKVNRVVLVTGGATVQIPIVIAQGNASAANVQTLVLPNLIGPQALAINIANPAGGTTWLGIQRHDLNKASPAIPVYLNGDIVGEANAPLRPILLARNDYSGGAACIATLLRSAGRVGVTELNAMEGMMAYGEREKIIARRGFSLLDMKLYLAALGITAYGLGTSNPLADLMTVMAEQHSGVILPVTIFGVTHFTLVQGITVSHVLLASPHFGNLAIPRDEITQVWGLLGPSGFPMFVVDIPVGWR